MTSTSRARLDLVLLALLALMLGCDRSPSERPRSERLVDPSWPVRRQAAGELGPPGLLEALRDPRSRDAALQRLLDTRAISVLVGASADPSPDVRRLAVEALVRLRPPAAEVLPVYLARLADADDTVHGLVLTGLHQLGLVAVPALLEYAGRPTTKEWQRAAARRAARLILEEEGIR